MLINLGGVLQSFFGNYVEAGGVIGKRYFTVQQVIDLFYVQIA